MPLDAKDRIAPRGKFRLIVTGINGDGNSFTSGEGVQGDYDSLESATAAMAAMGPTERTEVRDGLVVFMYTFCEVVDDAGNVVAGG